MRQFERATASLARGLLGTMIALVLALCFAAIIVLASDVRRAINAQASATGDNAQWTLAQVDVEFLYLKEAVSLATDPTVPLDDIRKRFNIIYSRSTTLVEGQTFAVLKNNATYAATLAALRGFLTQTIPLIDGPDDVLRAALPMLEAQIVALRPQVKRLALAGNEVFAKISDRDRQNILDTLILAGILTVVMIVVLLGLVVILLRLDRVNRARAREVMLTLARTESVLVTAIDSVMAVNSEGRVIEFNPAAEQVFGYDHDEIIGARMTDLILRDTMPTSDDAGLEWPLTADHAATAVAGRLRVTARRKDGTTFPAEMSVARSEDNSGEIFIAFLRDLSAEIAAETALLQARDEALAGEKAKAELLAVMSHEMRTPLNGMLGMLELLEDTPLQPRQREFLHITQSSGRLLMRHVNDVLSVARLESGKIPVELGTVDLQALVDEIFANQSAASAANGIDLRFVLVNAAPRYVIADQFQLQQILLNLIGNAIKFTRNAAVTVQAVYDAAAAVMEFRVIDGGIGIPQADLERIFDDFVTLDTTYSRSVGGTGLGLGITRRIVENLAGTVVAESTVGKGSVFRVRLPMQPAIAQTTAPAPAPPPQLVPSRQRKLHVLVVEDNPINRLVVREMLLKLGHSLQEAQDGEEALRLADTTVFDVILMDISMPLMDGVVATGRIRAGSGASKATPIVALTAHALAAEISRFKAAGIYEVLVKPVSSAMLGQVLDQVAAVGPATADGLVDTQIISDLIAVIGDARAQILLARFLEQTAVGVRELPKHGASVVGLQSALHKLGGSAALFGATKLQGALCELEDFCKAGDLAAAIAGLGGLSSVWDATRPRLQVYLPQNAGNPSRDG